MDAAKRVTIETFRRKKASGEKIAMVTAYDFASARMVDDAGVDGILVGDSLAMVILGHDSTLPVTMTEMLHHTRAVTRGTRRALVVGDMPFLSYQVNADEAVRNAGRFLQEAGACAVKIEGGGEMVPVARRLVAAGIPVMGHLGLTPQSVQKLGGYMLQAKESESARTLLADALALAQAGVFAIVLEKVPTEVAAAVTSRVPVPTIGIGSGPACDGQILVLHDMLGMFDAFRPKFVKVYAQVGEVVREAIGRYIGEVAHGDFPTDEHAWHMDQAELAAFQAGTVGEGR